MSTLGLCIATASEKDWVDGPSRVALLAQLEKLISHSNDALKEFQESSKLTKQEIAKFKQIFPSEGIFSSSHFQNNTENVHVTPHNSRFTQLETKEIPSSTLIRNALYSTQPVSDPPQSSITVDALENIDDISRNATNVATFSDDGTRDFFEEELRQMKRESRVAKSLDTIKNNTQLLKYEIERLMSYKPEPPQPTFLANSDRNTEKRAPMDCGCKK